MHHSGRRWGRWACSDMTADRNFGGTRGMKLSRECGGRWVGDQPRLGLGSALSYGAHSNLCVNQINTLGFRGAERALSAETRLRRKRPDALAMSEPGARRTWSR